MSTDKNTPEWMEKAERFGEAVAASLEKAGDRFAKALESLDDRADLGLGRRRHRVHVDDERKGDSTRVESLAQGASFQLDGHLYLRISPVTDGEAPAVDAVRLTTGDVRRVEHGTAIEAVTVKVSLVDEPAPEAEAASKAPAAGDAAATDPEDPSATGEPPVGGA